MTWNYRIVQYETGEVGIHEAHYNDKSSSPHSITKEPIIVGDSVEELYEILETLRKATDQYKDDILLYDDF